MFKRVLDAELENTLLCSGLIKDICNDLEKIVDVFVYIKPTKDVVTENNIFCLYRGSELTKEELPESLEDFLDILRDRKNYFISELNVSTDSNIEIKIVMCDEYLRYFLDDFVVLI